MYNLFYPAMAAVLSAIVVFILGPFIIPELHKLKFGQSIRTEGPKSHQQKTGTPTMGGIIIVLGILVGTLCFANFSLEMYLGLLMMGGYFVIGFIDDYIKVVLKRNLGLRAWQKLLGQIIIAILVVYLGTGYGVLTTSLWIPLFNVTLDVGLFYYLIVFLVLIGTTNAVNLTDGLDGLASGSVAIAAFTYTIIAIYFNKLDIAILTFSTVGATLAFLHFNKHPARIFMGDTGSLALGGVLAAAAILTQSELLLPIVGGLFVVEALSVIIQVLSYRYRNKKRVFLMSPIHHHFELKGWPETTVVYRFWFAEAVFCFLSLVILFCN